ncbi:MAG: di-heme-cytochrome C peroxidase [Pseudomonadota bacterium]
MSADPTPAVSFLQRLSRILSAPVRWLWYLLRAGLRRLRSIFAALLVLWRSLGPRWFRGVLLLILLAVSGWRVLATVLSPNLTIETVSRLHYLNEGWSDEDRERYYRTPQGTELLGLPYDWLVNLELPLNEQRLASAETMRGWGFIVDPGQRAAPLNPGNLPVGMTRHVDRNGGADRLDLTCAMCHTGELHYQGVALRVDGGQAVQSISTVARGEFITTLGASVLATYLNPAKWKRFADRTAGADSFERARLRRDLRAFLGTLKRFGTGVGALKWYPVTEGRGRTDAVGRIANVVFGWDLEQPQNYLPANAPVSYPFIWDIWRFDWVQYTGFTNQAMARNVGESLGVLAPIDFVDTSGAVLPESQFAQTTINIHGMRCIETVLRKLEPPRWPEHILGEIDIARAQRGKDMFAEQCVFCHGPHRSQPYEWPLSSGPGVNVPGQLATNWAWDNSGEVTRQDGKAYRVDWRSALWALPWIDTEVIGTDSTAADNYVDRRYDASLLVPGSDPVNAGDGLQLLLNRVVPILYQRSGVSEAEVADYDGLNVPFRISNRRAYKSRPLHGVWATPPFLHNGSVPTIHALLSPHRARPSTFYIGNREYDPGKLGYVTEKRPGSFLHDTRIPGNGNNGHLFTDSDVPGRIGRRLSENERMDLLEYLKVLGNPDFSERLGGDPQNWSRYAPAPEHPADETACEHPASRSGHAV